jgi:16S rRNA processing protein RimM
MQSSSNWVVLARLLRPQGRKGELLADLFTDFPEQLVGRTELFLTSSGGTAAPSTARPVEVTSSWLPVGKNRGRVVLQLAGIDSISAAESLAGFELVVSDDNRMPLDDESVYVSELVGCTLFDENVAIGEITDVQFPTSADGARLSDAAAMLIVQSSGGEVLVPFVKPFVKNLDLPARRLVMSLPAGLVEVNQKD